MAKITQLGSSEGRLCGVLAAAIARHVTAADKAAGAGRKGARFEHYFTSTLERATLALAHLELAVPTSQPRKKNIPAHEHALAMDADTMGDFVAANVSDGDDRLAEALAAFVGVACDFGGLSTEREPFTPPPPYVEAMRTLTRFGYAELVGDQYRWTDQIGPAMRASYFWDEELRSGATLARDALEAEAQAAWRTHAGYDPPTVLLAPSSRLPEFCLGVMRLLEGRRVAP